MSARVLLVEDDADLRLLLTLVLRRAGHVITAVETGEEALDLLTASAFDLVLLDIRLPGIDGFEVLEQVVRPLPATVIAMSAHAHQELAERALGLGCATYLIKPFTPRELLRVLDSQLGGPGVQG